MAEPNQASRWLPFEKPLLELEQRIVELERFTAAQGIDRSEEIEALRRHHRRLCEQIFGGLSPWDKVLMARHPARPYTLDYLRLVAEDFLELHGDRHFGDDPALVAGFATVDGRRLVVVGHQKGRDLRERQLRNFGSARPEGYRKAARAMELAERFHLPVLCLLDTPAAESRLEAEERGIAQAIAANLALMSGLRTPIVAVIIGEGGSGGALGIGVADRVLMLEHSVYSVIPPEGCAAILDTFGQNSSRAPEAAQALKLTAQDMLKLKVVEEVIAEPLGGAHRDPAEVAASLKAAALRHLDELATVPVPELVERRYQRYRAFGSWEELVEGGGG
jgi:acetyl-CoA carboxylase carboxyl transferase subunit alpha